MESLPHADECVIAPATLEQFHHYRDILWPLWSGPKTREENLALREIERTEAYSQDHRHLSWVLTDRKRPENTYSYVETQRRDAWSKDSSGKIENVPIYAIISVITPKENRRKGYSYRLLGQLHYLIADPANIGAWPSEWGPQPDLATMKKHLPPAELTHLSSFAPPGFYEGVLIGPKEDEREGWLTRPEENIMLNWDFADAAPSSPASSNLEWTYVYSTDYDKIAPEIAKAHLRELEATPVKEGDKVFRVRPDSPGILRFCDNHMVFGTSVARDMIPKDKPTGIRWYARGSSESTPPPFKSTDPLVLFVEDDYGQGELAIQMVLNISADIAEYVVDMLVEHCQKAKLPMSRMRALCPPKAFEKEVVRRGGNLEHREKWIPHGSCYYGPKGTNGWMLDNQIWTWA